jgi:hypothetical protein
MIEFEIYLEDLTKKAQKEFLKDFGLKKEFFKVRPVGRLYSPSEEEYEDYEYNSKKEGE